MAGRSSRRGGAPLVGVGVGVSAAGGGGGGSSWGEARGRVQLAGAGVGRHRGGAGDRVGGQLARAQGSVGWLSWTVDGWSR
jgi:hypothetical protein